MNRVWTQSMSSVLWAVFSFGVTLMRLLMAVLCFIYLMDGGMNSLYFPICTIIAIILLDHIDGRLFEKSFLNDFEIWKNRRRVFDSVSDRLCIQFFCIPILILQPEFVVIYFIILFKELLTSINCIKAYNRSIVLPSNTTGKISSISIGLAVILWLLRLYFVAYGIVPIILITGYISYVKYRSAYKEHLDDAD